MDPNWFNTWKNRKQNSFFCFTKQQCEKYLNIHVMADGKAVILR